MFGKMLLLLLLFPYLISTSTPPIELTDKTWKTMLHGEWMVEFYAPWCSACQQFKRTWKDFSENIPSKNVKVAAIDIVQSPSLSDRFLISALPAIFHVRDGVFRQFDGDRSLHGLKNYLEHQDWKNTEPVSSYLAPNSILMSASSSLYGLSVFLKGSYTLLHDHYRLHPWLIYIIFGIATILIGAIIAFGGLLLIDYFVAVACKFFANSTPNNKKERDENDAQKVSKSKKQTITTDASLTDENQDKEILESDSDENKDEEILEPDSDKDQTVRQRRSKN